LPCFALCIPFLNWGWLMVFISLTRTSRSYDWWSRDCFFGMKSCNMECTRAWNEFGCRSICGAYPWRVDDIAWQEVSNGFLHKMHYYMRLNNVAFATFLFVYELWCSYLQCNG
jgi:hypothetical protein